jgi:hypothetical protein
MKRLDYEELICFFGNYSETQNTGKKQVFGLFAGTTV